jgi:hypothetical protein
MFSFFKKKKTVAHIKLNGVIGNAGKFKQGIDFAGQEELIKKAFSLKKAFMCCHNYQLTWWITSSISYDL